MNERHHQTHVKGESSFEKVLHNELQMRFEKEEFFSVSFSFIARFCFAISFN